jgi:hypothetical protein
MELSRGVFEAKCADLSRSCGTIRPIMEAGRRQFLKDAGKLVVGGALFGHGIGHMAEGVLTEGALTGGGRIKKATEELRAQGITKSSAEFKSRRSQLVDEKNREAGYSVRRIVVDFVEALGGATLAKRGYNNLSDKVEPQPVVSQPQAQTPQEK